MATKAEVNYTSVAEALQRELEKSYNEYGADIIITVQRDGHKAEFALYDHAALVQGLIDALDYFISEE